MYKNIRISYAFAYFSNPVVGQGHHDLTEGFGYQTDGLEISSDHQYLDVWPYEDMSCRIVIRPEVGFLGRLLNFFMRRRPTNLFFDIKEKTTHFYLDQVVSVSFDNGWDDSCYSFAEISADKVNKDNRTRRIFDDHQILSPEELTRGKVVIYQQWHSGLEKTVPQKMVILEGSSLDDLLKGLRFKGLFLYDDGAVWEFWPFLQSCNVIPSPEGYFNNHSYLVDTGETMSEIQILEKALLGFKKLPE